jgi:hypothetical protein
MTVSEMLDIQFKAYNTTYFSSQQYSTKLGLLFLGTLAGIGYAYQSYLPFNESLIEVAPDCDMKRAGGS